MADTSKLVEVDHVREKLIKVLTDDNCPMLYMQGEVADLADYLIASGVTVQKWIPVTERLPETEDLVLVTVDGICGNVEFVGACLLADFEPGHGWWLDGYPDAEDFTISHWMPLPEPPKDT